MSNSHVAIFFHVMRFQVQLIYPELEHFIAIISEYDISSHSLICATTAVVITV